MDKIRFRYLPIKYNHSSRRGTKLEYIVVHDTGNPRKGAGAKNHYYYFSRANRKSSAHYFVDSLEIIQIVGDSRASWHCGDNQGFGTALNNVTNSNSIGVELCINSDGDYNKAYNNLIILIQNLMKFHNIPAEKVVRHYDVSRKNCPGTFKPNNWARWRDFKKKIKEPLTIYIDLSKFDTYSIKLKEQDEETKEISQYEIKGENSKYYKKGILQVIETTADNIYIQQLGGKTLRQVGAFGINGTFFDPKAPEKSESTWSISINNGLPIGKNAHINHPNKNIKRATIIHGEGKTTVERINNIDEVKRKVDWAIGGVGLYPSYDPKLEKVPTDITRKTNHTAIAFKGNTIYLIVSGKCTLVELRNRILQKIKPDGAIAIDGGGSTQLFYKNNVGIHTKRRLNSIIGLKLT